MRKLLLLFVLATTWSYGQPSKDIFQRYGTFDSIYARTYGNIALATYDSLARARTSPNLVFYVSGKFSNLSKPYFATVQEAVDSLPIAGGTIEVYPGVDSSYSYRYPFRGPGNDTLSSGWANVHILGKSNVYLKFHKGFKFVTPAAFKRSGQLHPWDGSYRYWAWEGFVALDIRRDTSVVMVENITVDGLEVDGQGWTQIPDSIGTGNGVTASYVKGLTIKNCYIHDVEASGISVSRCSYVRIQDNRVISGNYNPYGGNGIDVYGLSTDTPGYDSLISGRGSDQGFGHIITGNQVTDFNLGIDAGWAGSDNMVIANNNLGYCDSGINIEIADFATLVSGRNGGVTITGNVIHDSRGIHQFNPTGFCSGIAVATSGTPITRGKTVTITGNVIRNLNGVAISSFGGSEVVIANNVIENDTISGKYNFYKGIEVHPGEANEKHSFVISHNIITMRDTLSDLPWMNCAIDLASVAADDSLSIVKVDGNIIRRVNSPVNGNVWRHLSGIGIGPDVKNVSITNNFIEGLSVGMFLKSSNPNNVVDVFENSITKCAGAGIFSFVSSGGLKRRIVNNRIWNNGQDVTINDSLRVGIYSYMPLDSSYIVGNYIYDDQVSPTQTYGLWLNSGVGTKFFDNTIWGNKYGRIQGSISTTWEVRDLGQYYGLNKVVADTSQSGNFQIDPTAYFKPVENYPLPNITALGNLWGWFKDVRDSVRLKPPSFNGITAWYNSGTGPTYWRNQTGVVYYYPKDLDGYDVVERPSMIGIYDGNSFITSTGFTLAFIGRVDSARSTYTGPQIFGKQYEPNEACCITIAGGPPQVFVFSKGTSAGGNLPLSAFDYHWYIVTKHDSTVNLYQDGAQIGTGTVNVPIDTVDGFFGVTGFLGAEMVMYDSCLSSASLDSLNAYFERKYFLNGPTLKAVKVVAQTGEFTLARVESLYATHYGNLPLSLGSGSADSLAHKFVDLAAWGDGKVLKVDLANDKFYIGTDNTGGGGGGGGSLDTVRASDGITANILNDSVVVVSVRLKTSGGLKFTNGQLELDSLIYAGTTYRLTLLAPKDSPTFTGNLVFSLASSATGDIWYRGSDTYMKRLGIGTNGYRLGVVTGLPAWSPSDTVGIGTRFATHTHSGAAITSGLVAPAYLTSNSSTSAGIVASGSGQAWKFWGTDASGNPAWRDALSPTFNLIATGTNTGAVMTVGTGATINRSGTGIIDASRYLGVTTITAAEFGYLSGVSSAIQTQLNTNAAAVALRLLKTDTLSLQLRKMDKDSVYQVYGTPDTGKGSYMYLGADGKIHTGVGGTTTFNTTALRVAVYVAGLTTANAFNVNPLAVDAYTPPVAGDLMNSFCKTDSLIIQRAGGATSGGGVVYRQVK